MIDHQIAKTARRIHYLLPKEMLVKKPAQLYCSSSLDRKLYQKIPTIRRTMSRYLIEIEWTGTFLLFGFFPMERKNK